MPGVSALQKRTVNTRPEVSLVAKRVAAGTTGNSFATAAFPTGSNVQSMTRLTHRSPVRGRAVEIVYTMVYNTSEQLPAGNGGTVRASVEYPSGVLTPAYSADGKRDITLEAGGIGKLYAPGVEIPANANFWIRTRLSFTTSDAFPQSWGGISGNGDFATVLTTAAGSDYTATTSGQPAANSSAAFAPSLVTVIPEKPYPSVALIGDSITANTGDTTTDAINTIAGVLPGWALRALSSDGSGRYRPRVPAVNLSISGELASNIATISKSSKRFALVDASGATHAFVALGTNDLNQGGTVASLQVNLLTIWGWLAHRGIKVYANTLVPLAPTSTDTFATVANQTPSANDPNRVTYNNWLRDGAPVTSALVAVAAGTTTAGTLRVGQPGHPLTGYIELADAVESSRDSGKWQVGMVMTASPLHPSTAGHQAMAAAAGPLVNSIAALYGI